MTASAFVTCPICGVQNQRSSPRCASCGADWHDADVVAQAGAVAWAPEPAGEAGALAIGRFLGVTGEGLEAGRALRAFGALGGCALALAFFLPVARGRGGEALFSWDLLPDGDKLALLFPLVAGVLGVAIALVPRVPAIARAAVLLVVGGLGIALSLGPLGDYAGAPRQLATVGTLAGALGGAALWMRALYPTSRTARVGLCVAAGLAVVALFFPARELARQLAVEYAVYANMLRLDLDGGTLGGVLLGGLDTRAAPIFFLSFFAFLGPIALLTGAWLAWKQPDGLWDKSGVWLRPLALFAVLTLPLGYAALTFNASGWEERSAEGLLLARARLIPVATALALWIQLGLVALARADERRRAAAVAPAPEVITPPSG